MCMVGKYSHKKFFWLFSIFVGSEFRIWTLLGSKMTNSISIRGWIWLQTSMGSWPNPECPWISHGGFFSTLRNRYPCKSMPFRHIFFLCRCKYFENGSSNPIFKQQKNVFRKGMRLVLLHGYRFRKEEKSPPSANWVQDFDESRE